MSERHQACAVHLPGDSSDAWKWLDGVMVALFSKEPVVIFPFFKQKKRHEQNVKVSVLDDYKAIYYLDIFL